MRKITTCEQCAAKFPDEYCSECKKRYDAPRNLFLEGCMDVWLAISHHLNPQIFWHTFKNFVVYPGRSIHQSIKDNYISFMKPFQYFALSIMCYSYWISYILQPQHIYIGLSAKLSFGTLTYLLLLLSLLAFIISGLGQISFLQVFFSFCYVYGTLFFLNPFILLLESFFTPFLNRQDHITRIVLSDLPCIAFIFFSIWDFFSFRKLGVLRYALTGLIGIGIYLAALKFLAG